MNRVGQEMLGLLGLMVLGLVGCASQPGSAVPIEDRTHLGNRPMPSAVVIAPSVPSVSNASATIPVAPSRGTATPEVAPTISTSITPATGPYSAPAAGVYAGPSPVLLALMEQADGLESRGDRQGALAQLERAQRIAPRDPLVYLQLARLRLHMGDRVRAEQLARKGLSLANGDPDLVLAFGALLAELTR